MTKETAVSVTIGIAVLLFFFSLTLVCSYKTASDPKDLTFRFWIGSVLFSISTGLIGFIISKLALTYSHE